MVRAARVGDLEPGDPKKVGSYRLTGRIGAGGMGVVYAGHKPGTPQDLVAIKVIRQKEGQPRGADPDRAARLRFAQEAAIIQLVNATCTPTIFETGLYGRRPWMAMEYVSGQTLSQHVRTYGTLSGEQLFSFGLGTAEALAAIHRAGVVHLDLTPGNIILSEDGPRVLDFGLARALNIDPLHESSHLFGTPGYISPERVHGALGPPADVFAWGAVMAFAATRTNPFGAVLGTRQERIRASAERARQGGADLSQLPEAVRDVVGRALSPRPEQRPSAMELFTFFAESLDETTTVEPGGSTRDLTSRLLDENWRITEDGGVRKQRRGPVGAARRGVVPKPARRRRGDADALVFAHQSFTDPGRLATAMASRPAEAERWLRDGGAARLRAWLAGRKGAETVADELETAGSGGTAAQRTITVFAAVFRPGATPRYRGVAVDADGLAELARRGPRGADRAVLTEVFDHGVVAALGRCGHARLKQLASGVPALTEAAVNRLTRAERAVDEEHRRRARELAVLSLLGEEPQWSRPDGERDREWWRGPAGARRDTGDGGRPAALIALALYPSTAPRASAPPRARPTAKPRRVPALFAPPRQVWATLRPRALLALVCYTVWQVLALAVGMLTRTIGEPYVYATASRVGREFGAVAAERAADLFVVLLAVALGVVVLRAEALRWVSAVGTAAAVLLALPPVPFPGVWAPEWLRFLLHETAAVWGSMVAWGGLLGCVSAAVGAVHLWRAMPRKVREP